MNIYYTKESPRNKEYDKYPYFRHVIKPQDDIVGYYALKQDFKYVVLRNVCDSLRVWLGSEVGKIVKLDRY